jgi:hypothetical protein
VHSSNA